jgi:NAD(P)-dependent dehydrogenase (short-subunit alcohol dehydrogenase family)
VARFIDDTVQREGKLDILFNNAGINPVGTVVDTPEEVWDRTISTNLKGAFLGCKYAIPHMIRQGGGSIINMASVNGLSGFYNEVAYDASKGGVVLLTKSTALDFGPKNIRVNCICPGITDTPMVRGLAGGRHIDEDYEGSMKAYSNYNAALRRLITPEEVARAALFLASDESSGVTGAALVVDGGYTAI